MASRCWSKSWSRAVLASTSISSIAMGRESTDARGRALHHDLFGGEIADHTLQIHLIAGNFAAVGDNQFHSVQRNRLNERDRIILQLDLFQLRFAFAHRMVIRRLASELVAVGYKLIDIFLKSNLGIEFGGPFAGEFSGAGEVERSEGEHGDADQ